MSRLVNQEPEKLRHRSRLRYGPGHAPSPREYIQSSHFRNSFFFFFFCFQTQRNYKKALKKAPLYRPLVTTQPRFSPVTVGNIPRHGSESHFLGLLLAQLVAGNSGECGGGVRRPWQPGDVLFYHRDSKLNPGSVVGGWKHLTWEMEAGVIQTIYTSEIKHWRRDDGIFLFPSFFSPSFPPKATGHTPSHPW